LDTCNRGPKRGKPDPWDVGTCYLTEVMDPWGQANILTTGEYRICWKMMCGKTKNIPDSSFVRKK